MNWKAEWKPLALIAGLFVVFFFLPVGTPRFDSGVNEALHLAHWYAREHVLLCLVPAFFIAGAISVFVSQASVMKYLGARANKFVAYGVASVSGTILAVCSCTVLPLFAGIYKRGAGLGPASAFLYSGPAISVLAIILTARILGMELGVARAVGAISFSLIIGVLMHLIFRKEEEAKAEAQMALPEPEVKRPLWKNALFFASMVGILVFANWGAPPADRVRVTHVDRVRDAHVFCGTIVSETAEALTLRTDPLSLGGGATLTFARSEVGLIEPEQSFWRSVYEAKWWVTGACAAALVLMLAAWFGLPWWKAGAAAAPVILVLVAWPLFPEAWQDALGEYKRLLVFSVGTVGLAWVTSTQEGEAGEWFAASWGLAKQILPLLLGGVLLSGLLLGRPGKEGWIPNAWVAVGVGGEGLLATFVSSFLAAFMYFATLTEVPILQGLMGSGMGHGPALALLLAGPALSLPSMLVIRSVLGTKKTVAFVTLVVVLSTLTGWAYGNLRG